MCDFVTYKNLVQGLEFRGREYHYLPSSKRINMVGMDCQLIVLALWVGGVVAWVILLQKASSRET